MENDSIIIPNIKEVETNIRHEKISEWVCIKIRETK